MSQLRVQLSPPGDSVYGQPSISKQGSVEVGIEMQPEEEEHGMTVVMSLIAATMAGGVGVGATVTSSRPAR